MLALFGMTGLTQRSDATLLLARAAARTWGLHRLPATIRLAAGKPVFQDAPELHFNLSHSGSFALCALSDAPVGVDIEAVRPRRPGLAEHILSPAERTWYQANGGDDAALLTLWTRKEALCKKQGSGLTFPVRDITPPLPDVPWGESGMTSFSGGGWVASLCGSGPPPDPITWWTCEEIKGGTLT